MKKKISLKPYEEKTLKVVKKLKDRPSIKKIAEKANLAESTVNTVLESLKDKNLVNIFSKERNKIHITEEGKEYVSKGLPERRILNYIEEICSIKELKEGLKISKEKIKIGIGWLSRKKYIKITNGSIKLTEKGKKVLERDWDEEKILKIISKKQPLFLSQLNKKGAKKISKRLEKRELIKIKKVLHKTVTLTKKGEKVLKGEIKTSKKITKLNSKLITTGKWTKVNIAKYDVSLASYDIYPGKKHFMRQVLEYVRRIWLEMGFKEMDGPMLDISFWDYDALYVPQDHPARDLQDTFYMKVPEKGVLPNKKLVNNIKSTHETGWETGSTGWGYNWNKETAKKCLLRTHTTSLSARTLSTLRKDIKENNLPAKYFSVGRCFRNETPDWKHLVEFYQTDGIVVDENANFRNMLGYLKEYFSKLGFEKARFRPGYFPYTEFSLQVEVFHPKYEKWMELGGAGIFRPEVVKPLLGKDIPVLAWGPGFERLVMPHYNIDDVRETYSNDLEFLRKTKMWVK